MVYILIFIEYPTDISPYSEFPGRVCAKSCDGISCPKDGEVCTPKADSEPICQCPGTRDRFFYCQEFKVQQIFVWSLVFVIDYWFSKTCSSAVEESIN